MATQKTLRTYFRPEPRCSRLAQDSVAEASGAKIIPYVDLDEWFASMRKGDIVAVPFFHRLAANAEDLKAVRERLKAAGVVVLELATGRRTSTPDEYADMVQEALDFTARRGMTTAEAKRLGKLGADMSPATKSRTDRMPLELAEEILNNHAVYPTLDAALYAINHATDANGKRFKRPYNREFIYRMARIGKLNLKVRRSGPKVKR